MLLVVISHAVEEESEIIHTPILLETRSQKSRIKSAVRRNINRTPNLEVIGTGIGIYVVPNGIDAFKLPPRSRRIYFLHCSKIGWTEEYKLHGESHHRTVTEQSQLRIFI